MPGAWASSVARMRVEEGAAVGVPAAFGAIGRELDDGREDVVALRARGRPRRPRAGRSPSPGARRSAPYLTGLKASSTARTEGAITRRVRRSAPRKSGAPVSARCSLAAVPRMRMLRDAADEAGVEVARAEQVEEGGARVDRRDGGAGEDQLAVVEAHAHHLVVGDLERGDAGAGADGDALRGDRLRHRLGDGAHAALRQREAGGVAGGLAGQAVVAAASASSASAARSRRRARRRGRGRPSAGRRSARRRARRRRWRAGGAGTRAGRRGPWRASLRPSIASFAISLPAPLAEARRGQLLERPQHAGVAQQPRAQRRPGGAVGVESAAGVSPQAPSSTQWSPVAESAVVARLTAE